jgi:hypothetical protein
MSDDEQRDANGKSGHETAAQAARAAAAAAAVGAALGAVRALASRGDDENAERESDERVDEGDTVDDDTGDDSEPEASLQAESSGGEQADEAEQPEPVEQTRAQAPPPRRERAHVESKPREGASSSTVRSVVARAREQLHDLQGRDPESVTALERIDGGWRITCEVVELERIPNSTDVLATYVVELDGDGELLQYERIRRYYRAQADIGDDV